MNTFYKVYKNIDFGFYPNYSFDIGDVNGDGKAEFIVMDREGNLLRVMDLNGDILFDKVLENNGNWGTPIFCTFDVDNDGCDEIIFQNGKSLIIVDGTGNIIKEHVFEDSNQDDYFINIPLIGTVDNSSVIAAVAGGEIYKLDFDLNVIWVVNGLRNDFGHEIHFADIDGDGFEEILVCTVDNINRGFDAENCVGDLLILDHDGKILLRKRVDELYKNDTHFDDIAVADFIGDGTYQILLEKGMLIDLQGNVIWDLQNNMNHGQWISYADDPAGPGKICFISELWGPVVYGLLFNGRGEVLADLKEFPWPDAPEGVLLLPTRTHSFENGFFVSQQMNVIDYEFIALKNRPYSANALFLDRHGNLLGNLSYEDSQIEGYYYNGETHSKVYDVDGDGILEIVYPKQDGCLLIIKSEV